MEPGLIHAQLASGQALLGSLILNLCPHNYGHFCGLSPASIVNEMDALLMALFSRSVFVHVLLMAK
jgi:hypothetical protein